MGWSFLMLDEMRGVGPTATGRLVRDAGETVTRTMAREVEGLYERLAMRHGPSSVTKARARAAGWLPPLAWDDIDDPDEVPSAATAAPVADVVDEIAVARVVSGESLALTPAERVVAVRRLAALRLSDSEIAERCGVHPKTIARDRRLHGIAAGDPITHPNQHSTYRRTA